MDSDGEEMDYEIRDPNLKDYRTWFSFHVEVQPDLPVSQLEITCACQV